MQHSPHSEQQPIAAVEILPPSSPPPQALQPLQLKLDEGLTPETSLSLRTAFEGFFTQADKWRASALAIQITSVDQVREMKLARETRLALREIRINADKRRKELKEDSLRKGKAIDGLFNILAYAVEPLEKHLLEQEQFAERIENERKEKLRANRENALSVYGVDVSLYQLAEMTEESFQNLLETNRLAYLARQEVARKAEQERIERERIEAEERAARDAAATAERERLRAENEKLAREKAEQEAANRAERERVEAEHKAERERLEAERRAELARIEAARVESEKKAAKEREASAALARAEAVKREALEAELRAKQEAEAREKAERDAAERAAAKAPDREKLLALAQAIRALPIPSLDSEVGQGIINLIREQAEKFAKWIETQTTKLN